MRIISSVLTLTLLSPVWAKPPVPIKDKGMMTKVYRTFPKDMKLRGPAADKKKKGVAPHDPGFLVDAEGIIGGALSCKDSSLEELKRVDEAVSVDIEDRGYDDIVKSGPRTIQIYLEQLVFQEIAQRSHRTTQCQLNFLKTYSTDKNYADSMNDKAFKIYEIFHPLLVKMMTLRNEKLSNANSLRSTFDHMDKSSVEAKRRNDEFILRTEISALDERINALIAQLPLGNQKTVRKVGRDLLNKSSLSNHEFISSYSYSLRNLLAKFQDAEEYYLSALDGNGFYKLTRGDKIAFVQSGQANQLLAELDPKGDGLSCRIKARYDRGPANTQLALNLGLLAATVLTDGVAAVLAGAGMTATMIKDVATSCFAPTMNISGSAQMSCDPMDMANSTLSQASMISCSVNATFLALPVLAPFAGEMKAAYNSLRALQTDSGAAKKVVGSVAKTEITAAKSTSSIEVVPRVNVSPELMSIGKEMDPYLKSLPVKIQERLKAKFFSQTEKQTIDDLNKMRDLRRINSGSCK